MPITALINPPSLEPITLAEAKAHLRVDHDEDDDLISNYITSARTQAENYLQRTLLETVWEATFTRFETALKLRKAKVTEIVTVKYLDTAGAEQTLASDKYKLKSSYEPALLVPAFGLSWPATCQDLEAVKVRYKAGYGTTADKVPQPICQWILLQVGNLYENRETEVLGITSTLSDSFFTGLLDAYRIMEA